MIYKYEVKAVRPGRFEVGYHIPDGMWVEESTYDQRHAAIKRANWLNQGTTERICSICSGHINECLCDELSYYEDK
jgi:hypothetical protein